MWIALAKLRVRKSIVTLISSFHEGMKAACYLTGRRRSQWRMGSDKVAAWFMSFQLVHVLAVERWIERVEGEDGVGITVKYKMDGKLFQRYTRNSCERRITKCQFADHSALLASTRSGAVKTVTEYQQTCRDFNLMVSILKMKQEGL